jgi:hypothetical protein
MMIPVPSCTSARPDIPSAFTGTKIALTNKNLRTPSENRRPFSRAGIGANWLSSNNFLVKAYLAHKIGHQMVTSAPDAVNRFWAPGEKCF